MHWVFYYVSASYQFFYFISLKTDENYLSGLIPTELGLLEGLTSLGLGK
jgi:hypothetical protein